MISIDTDALDKADPLASCAELFHKPKGIIYLDGNSLGLMPKAVAERVRSVTENQWGNDLIASWNKHNWIDLSTTVGDKIGKLIGAATNQVVCCDSISVNLFKVITAVLKKQAGQGKTKIISTEDNFPTDLYMVQGITSLLGENCCRLELVEEHQLGEAIDENTAMVLATEVNFRTGKRLDIAKLTAHAHQNDAFIAVDLAHSAGVLPVTLDKWEVDFAVGCTYKYLNAGPGAPGFVYAAKRHQKWLDQPMYGWMGHANAFEFSGQYEPADDARQMLVGTPPIISLSAVDSALDVYEGVSICDLRDKSKQITDTFLTLVTQSEACNPLRCISPVSAEQRGSQLSFSFEHAYGLCQALIACGVIADFRAPDVIRFGFAPLYTSYKEVNQAVCIMSSLMQDKAYLNPDYNRKNKVT